MINSQQRSGLIIVRKNFQHNWFLNLKRLQHGQQCRSCAGRGGGAAAVTGPGCLAGQVPERGAPRVATARSDQVRTGGGGGGGGRGAPGKTRLLIVNYCAHWRP